MKASSGAFRKDDLYAEVSLDCKGITVEIESKVKALFQNQMERAVGQALAELGIEDAHVRLQDWGALDFAIRARVKTAVKRALAEEVKDHE